MNDRDQDVGLIAVIVGGVLFLGFVILVAAGIIAWMLYRNASLEMIEAERAAIEARQAQVSAIENEAAEPTDQTNGEEVQEASPD